MLPLTLTWVEWLNPSARTSTRNEETSTQEREHQPETRKHRPKNENINPKRGNIDPGTRTSTRNAEHQPETRKHRPGNENINPIKIPAGEQLLTYVAFYIYCVKGNSHLGKRPFVYPRIHRSVSLYFIP